MFDRSGFTGPLPLISVLIGLAATAGCRCLGDASPPSNAPEQTPVRQKLESDFCEMYAPTVPNVALWSAGLGLGATLAHTDVDECFRQWYQEDVRSTSSDGLAEAAKHFGEGQEMVPLMAGALLLGQLAPECPTASVLGDWGELSLRATLVGAPSVLLLQAATGASRPGETQAESDWVPWHDNNGVSGHAFMGAVPFISAAKMTDDPVAKAGWYAASTLTAWSRVNDDAHYASQALLGWWFGYLACSAVGRSEASSHHFQFTAVPMPGGVGIGFVFEQ